MGRTGLERGVAASGREHGLFHTKRVSAQQRIHLAALLIGVLAFAAAASAGEISFDPSISQEDFHAFSSVMGQAIFPTPVDPASARGLLSFSVGVFATAMPIDEHAAWWVNSVGSDFSTQGYVLAPRLVVSKGLGVVNVSASYGQIPGSGVNVYGGAVDIPVIDGGVVTPTLSVRASYGTLTGIDEFEAKTYGAEAFLSKGFGPVTPYGAAGIVRTSTIGRIPGAGGVPARELRDESDQPRYTLGVRFSLLVTRFAFEATKQEDTSYAAKIDIGL